MEVDYTSYKLTDDGTLVENQGRHILQHFIQEEQQQS